MDMHVNAIKITCTTRWFCIVQKVSIVKDDIVVIYASVQLYAIVAVYIMVRGW